MGLLICGTLLILQIFRPYGTRNMWDIIDPINISSLWDS